MTVWHGKVYCFATVNFTSEYGSLYFTVLFINTKKTNVHCKTVHGKPASNTSNDNGFQWK